MDELVDKLVSIISDYRKDDQEFNYEINSKHVERWVEQFDEKDRRFVLKQTIKLLETNYFNKEKYLKNIEILANSHKLSRGDKKKYWSNVSLLSIQEDGDSQKEMNDFLIKRVSFCYGVNIPINDFNMDRYIYLDDFSFSGDRIKKDIDRWLINFEGKGFSLDIVLFSLFSYGEYSLSNYLEKKSSGGFFNFDIWRKSQRGTLENKKKNKNESDVFWPKYSVVDIDSVAKYIDSEQELINNKRYKTEIIYRDENTHSKLFDIDGVDRDRYENILYKAGCLILSKCNDRQATFRPLGYSVFPGHGFGGTIFTYRNCPNNAPLAFWWGGKDENNWYPLLPRKGYKKKSNSFDFLVFPDF